MDMSFSSGSVPLEYQPMISKEGKTCLTVAAAMVCGEVSMTSTIAVGAFSRNTLRSTHIALGES